MVNRLVGKRRPYNQLHSFKTATFIFSKFEHFWISKARPAPSSTVANQCILLYSYFKLFYLSVNSCIDKRLNSARGSGTGLVTVGPAKVKAVQIREQLIHWSCPWCWNKDHLVDEVNTLYLISLCLATLRSCKVFTFNFYTVSCLWKIKVAIFALGN